MLSGLPGEPFRDCRESGRFLPPWCTSVLVQHAVRSWSAVKRRWACAAGRDLPTACDGKDGQLVTASLVEPSQKLRELGVPSEVFLEMCKTITGVMRQLLMENLG